jgi:hypothetical protein
MAPAGNKPVDDAAVPPDVKLVRRLVELLDAMLVQWNAYDADQALPPAQRAGVALPVFGRESCLALRARYVAALANFEAGACSLSWG